MNTDSIKEKLIAAYKTMRTYAYHVIEDLKDDEAHWQPGDIKSRSIYSYARHMVNTEIYWMKALAKDKNEYITNNTPLNGIVSAYKTMEEKYLNLLNDATIDDLKITPTRMDRDENVVTEGTLAWTVLRITLHAFGHISHINHIRYSMGKPPSKEGNLWWEATGKLINLSDYNQ